MTMASAAASSFTLAPLPRPRLPFKGFVNLSNPRPKTLCLTHTPTFKRGFSAELVREHPRVFSIPIVRDTPGGGCRRSSSNVYWRRRAVPTENENSEGHDEDLYNMMKLLVSTLSFVSVNGNPNKGVAVERRDSILQYISSNGGAVVPPEEYDPYLVSLLEKYTDIRARQKRSRELEFPAALGGKLLSLIRLCWAWLRLGAVASFLSSGFFYVSLFTCVVVCRLAAGAKPSVPEFGFGVTVLTALLSLAEKLGKINVHLSMVIYTLILCMRLDQWKLPSEPDFFKPNSLLCNIRRRKEFGKLCRLSEIVYWGKSWGSKGLAFLYALTKKWF